MISARIKEYCNACDTCEKQTAIIEVETAVKNL
jgi:hypothetical protein